MTACQEKLAEDPNDADCKSMFETGYFMVKDENNFKGTALFLALLNLLVTLIQMVMNYLEGSNEIWYFF